MLSTIILLKIWSFFQIFVFWSIGGLFDIVQLLTICTTFSSAVNLPIFSLQDDRVLEVVGDPTGVHKALELIASHLRKFLVDHSVISDANS